MGGLEGKVAIITGAAGGFGQVLVRAFLDAGARVAALDVDEGRLGDAVAGAAGNRFLGLRTDIADYGECERAVAQARAALGGVHVLINNGALGMGVIRADCMTRLVDIEETTPAMWQTFVSVNFTGQWNMTRAAIPHLRAQQWGRIIDVTTSFFTMLRGGFQPYGPCKAGVEAMASAHAQEFQASGV